MAKKPIGPLCISDSVELKPRRNLSESALLFTVTGFFGGCCSLATLARLLYIFYPFFVGSGGRSSGPDSFGAGGIIILGLLLVALIVLGGLAMICMISSGVCFQFGCRNLFGDTSKSSVTLPWVFWGLSIVSLVLFVLGGMAFPFIPIIPH